MTRFAEVAVCVVLFVALANCRSFEDLIHHRGLKTVGSCYNYQTGLDWPGNNINTQPLTNMTDALSCCFECNRLYGARVKAYIYRTGAGHCYCKTQASNPTPCVVCQGSNFALPDPPPTCTRQDGVDSFGYDLRGPIEGVAGPADCCNLCYQYGPRCAAYLWRSDNNRCYVKSRIVPLTPCPECVFGRPLSR